MRVLLTGANGQIGSEVLRAFSPAFQVIPVSSMEIDLANPLAIGQTVRQIQPDLIVNAAGYTAVEQAESEPELAMTVNGEPVGMLGREAARIGAAIVHFSTDYV